MPDLKELENIFVERGYTDFKWIDPKEIVVNQWVRMKCTYGCDEYGKNACCPPNLPSVAECRKFFNEYRTAAIFHFEKKIDKPEERHQWTKKISKGLSKLEREVFLSGYHKAFLLFMDSCSLCKDCTIERSKCKHPKQARPTPEAMAVSVFDTVRKVGFPIEVLKNYNEEMNRYAFLMVE
ncbi:MAG: metal-binding protein [Ignavibacteria bacterium RBG_13_36_8]|nr:MAG: metal-binding protein [Ignavibacteria bacterium RBG_13_36_8]